jgi:hypothetical protein
MDWLAIACWGLLIFAWLAAAILVGFVSARLLLSALDSRFSERLPEVRDAHSLRH